MSRKRKDELVDRDELMNLIKIAKSWEFTCTFCFKKFASAQAMGGHQNAHRNERLEEKKHHIKDLIGHRMRVFLLDKKAAAAAAEGGGLATNSSYGGGPSSPVSAFLASDESRIFNAGCDGNNNFVQPWSSEDSSVANNNINGGNPKIEADFAVELSLGVGGEEEGGGKGKACVHDFNIDGFEFNLKDHNLDLTLKL